MTRASRARPTTPLWPRALRSTLLLAIASHLVLTATATAQPPEAPQRPVTYRLED
jgi:hypothetical protein